MRPLEGIRVLDLTRLLPGPYATLLLADLGADVVRVEDKGDSDFVRWLPPAVPDPTGGPAVGALFLALNRNKRSIVLDLKAPEGKEAFLKLAEKADVVIEGNRPGVMDRLGVGWKQLSAELRTQLATLRVGRNPRALGLMLVAIALLVVSINQMKSNPQEVAQSMHEMLNF